LRLEPSSAEIIGGVHIEVIAAAASFVQMSINGAQLLKTKTHSSFLSRLRKLFRKQVPITLAERSKPTQT